MNGYGKHCRIGEKFHEDLIRILDERAKKGGIRVIVSMEKLTNLMTRHKLWGEIVNDLMKVNEEEVKEYVK